MANGEADGLVPTKPKGGVDWLAYIRTGWPVVLAFCGMVWWIAENVENHEQKQARIDATIARFEHVTFGPTLLRLSLVESRIASAQARIDAYDSAQGHPIVNNRIREIESRLTAIDQDLRRIFQQILPRGAVGAPGIAFRDEDK